MGGLGRARSVFIGWLRILLLGITPAHGAAFPWIELPQSMGRRPHGLDTPVHNEAAEHPCDFNGVFSMIVVFDYQNAILVCTSGRVRMQRVCFLLQTNFVAYFTYSSLLLTLLGSIIGFGAS